ncbi:uncharacterized protein BT62DRAFT_912963 [Guyanagaster necrorhizus]|uniref:FAD-binding FR-type domain-containing protein n=1 Tax=Guyanagaster necrorhizus TaxID=856835 RepID=A0A9P8ALC4_9AGAR|nr:uncharacterized protein BT62DRAFT_912963 [Guyanagaster necrorhizus MCA 3950]KAG7439640.1 hypothetical protein BT62DRAFT_912963 [Guyanagaster necrorhizus MCA 3950]
MSLYGWHPGERSIREKLGFDKDHSLNWLYTYVDGDLPPDHGVFYSTLLPFLPVTTLDSMGRPWGSILAGADGKPGFISNPRYTTLSFNVKVWDGDPFIRNARDSGDGEMLMAGIGVEFSTRRRNKFAGKITKGKGCDDGYRFEVHVNEAIGNCPKYIPLREFVPYQGSPTMVYDKRHLRNDEELPDSVVSFVHSCDTTFFGTTYAATADEASRFPSHLGMNIRGGRPGFIRVRPVDKRTLVLPDFSGNRIMTSLGNVEATSLASLTFISFTRGDILYVTGRAQNRIGPDAQKLIFLQERLTTIYVTGYIFVRDALPVRQRPGTSVELSPYSPPVRHLVEESAPVLRFDDDSPATAALKIITLHSPTIATFTWDSSRDLDIIPGQAIILDFSGFIGHPGYRHMAPGNPTSVNDDRIRTWTVSSSHVGPTLEFAITVREKPGGAATGALFSLARRVADVKPGLLADMRSLGLSVPIVGVTGDFTLPKSGKRKLALFAGGIGLTPFLSMLNSLGGGGGGDEWDVVLVLSTREPGVLVPLIPRRDRLAVHIFTNELALELGSVIVHRGRVTAGFLLEGREVWTGREVFVCGPEGYRECVVDGLVGAGVGRESIRLEGFEY